jgi:hypothetical protein
MARLADFPIFGRVHSYERYSKTVKDLIALYTDNGKLAGGFLKRPKAKVTAGGSMGNGKVENYELILVRGWEDAEESQLKFDDALDNLMEEFSKSHRLGDWTSLDGENIGFELMKNEPAMFGGVLVHYAVLAITLTKR